MKRRTYLATTASLSALSLAGCTDSSSLDDGSENGDVNGTTTEPTTPTGPSSENESESDSDRPAAAGTEDDFSDLEAWTVTGGTLTADTERVAVGSQSARLEVPATARVTRLEKTLAEPRDCSDVVPGVAVAADDLVRPRLRLVDDEGNAIEYRRGIAGDLPLMCHDFGVETVDPGFDPASVCEIRVRVWTGEGERRTVWFDDLHFTPRPETGKVLIQFDDAHLTDYTRAFPILEEYGYPAVTFVNGDYVDTDAHVTTDQLRELRDAGWCVANHTRSHANLPELDAAEQEAQIRAGKEWLVDHGFEDGADYFAYPFGRYDATTIDLVDDHHALGFAGGRPAHGYAATPGLLPRIGDPGADEVRRAVELTAERRGITSIFYHRLEGEVLESFETMAETIREYESRGDLEVILPRDLEDRFLL